MQLLKITSTPIKYRIESEQATLSVVNPNPGHKTEGQVQNQKITVSKDGSSYQNNIKYDSSTVLGDDKKIRADKSFQKSVMIQEKNKADSAYQYSRNNSKVQNRNRTIRSVVNNNSLSNIDVAISHVKSVMPDNSWEPDKKDYINLKADVGNISEKKLEFTPPSYKLIVEELADVKIEYLGGINYFPKSSAPDYEKKDDI